MAARSISKATSIRRPRRANLAAGISFSALAIASSMASPAVAGTYTVNSGTEFAAAIAAANADADPNATIILGSSFSVSGALPVPTKTITVNLNGNVLTTAATIASGSPSFPGMTLSTSGGVGQLVNSGAISGAAAVAAGNLGSVGVTANGLMIVNSGAISGGDSNAYSGSVLNPAAGVTLAGGSTLTNSGTVLGGNSQGSGAGTGVFASNLAVGSSSSVVNTSTGIIRGGSDLTAAVAGTAGITVHGAQPFALDNSGLIQGGNAAAAIAPDVASWTVSIVNSGTIQAGTGSAIAIGSASAMSGSLTLELRAGSVIQGNVIATSGGTDTLRLGGTSDSSFDISAVGPASQYRNFDLFEKTGASTWTLAGDSAVTTNWTIQQGTLTVGNGGGGTVLLGNVTNNAALVFNRNGTTAVTGVLSGTGSVRQIGAGVTTLSGVNTYSGGTFLDGGTLSVGADSNLGAAAVPLSFNGGVLQWTGGNFTNTRTINWGANGGGFDIGGAAGYTLPQALTGSGSLTKLGSGTLMLSGDNTYTGGTTITAGTLRLGIGGTTGSIQGNVVDNGTFAISRSDSWTFGGSITGTGGISSISPGTTTLTGNSNYGGGTSLTGGAGLRILGATVSSGGALFPSGGTFTVDAGGVFNTATANASSIGGVAGIINVRNGGVLHATGNLTLRNSPTNVVLSTLSVSGAGSLADIGGTLLVAASGSFNVNGISVTGGGKLTTGGASTMGAAAGNTTAPFITISGAGSDWTSASSLTMTNGALSLLNGGTASLTSVTAGSVSAAFPAAITIAGVGSRLTTSSDLIIGSGAGTGSLVVSDGGQASVGGSLLLGNGATSTGILNIGGAEGQLAAGIGAFDATAIVFGGTGSRISFNHTDPAYRFATLLSGAGSVNQVAGTTILSANNSYSGTTTVSGGTLRINGDQSAATGLTSVASGATLGGTGKIGGSVTIANGGTLAPGNSPGTITIAGDLTLNSGSLLDYEFGEANVVGGPLNDLTKVGGNLVLDGAINVTVTAGGNFDPGVYRVVSYGGTLTDNGLSVGTIPAGSVVAVQTSTPGQVNLVNSAGVTLNFWDGTAGPKNNNIINGGNGTWQASGGNDNWTDSTAAVNAGYSDGAFAVFSSTPGTVSVDNSVGAVTTSGMQFLTTGYVLSGGALTLTGQQAVVRVGDGTADGAGYSATIGAVLMGASQLVKTDLGTLILTGANSYAGGTIINGGTVQIASDANLGNVVGGLTFNGGGLHTTASFGSSRTVNLVGIGIVDTDAATALNLDGVLSGAGGLVKQGSGRLTLTADNTYSGGTTILTGSLQVGNGGTTGSVVGNIIDNAELALDRVDTNTIAGQISGTGAVRKLGSGTTILTSDNSYTGGTTNASGILQLGNGGTTGGIVGDIINDGSLVFDRSNTFSFVGTITGAGGVRQAGTGTTILSGGNSYAGTTQVDAGTLLINGDQSAATGLTSVASGATLGGTGTIGSDVAVADGGVLAPGSNGAGTLHIGGNLTLVATSQLNFQFGQAGTAGGALNDLVDVTGNLTLDGTINVAATPAGSFGAGLYRIANYGGTLTDNGLSVGTLPSGFDATVQTSVAQQVNLIASASVPPGGGSGSGGLSFWDGAAGPKGNSAIDGGDGVWQNSTSNDNWTNSTGAANGPYTDGTLAIFAAAPGTVTVDDGLGAVTASGLQFASDGYRITGDVLTLTGTQAAIRVGVGTAAGAGYTATVSAVLAGSAQLAKTDLGTLVLAGANTYTGGTLVSAGTLLVNGDSSAATGATNVASGAMLGGTGTIGGNVAFANGAILAPGSKAPGTLTTKGDLSLSAGTQLAYQLGQANAAGGALNDLVNVGGNLVLDGTLNVSVPAGGAFGVGVYRLFNYGGSLTDNGLTLGTLPATGVTVQTSVAGQVNLVNGAGLALNFWDGTAPRGDNAVGGGSGAWQNGTGNDNWTDANGAINGTYADGAFAIFGGTGGTVTVDNSLGAVNSGGMQFAANGYTIGGGTLMLSGAQSIVRVGDGTAAGAQFSATIGATLSGTAQLVKTDLGTLILGATNGYSGGTLITAGTLQIASDANLGAAAGGVTLDGGTLATSADLTSARNVALASGGAISTAGGTTFTIEGTLSGSGGLSKAGTGTLRLTGDGSAYAGATRVAAGTLRVDGALGGNVAIEDKARLQGNGRVGSVVNQAGGMIAPGNSIGHLTIAGDYVGAGGSLEIEAVLGGDASPADLLTVQGSTSGTTDLTLTNRGGLGAQTVNGIKVIDVAGASNGTFALKGDYVFQGDQALIAGAYGYRLYKGGVASPSDGDWYLRSTLLDAQSPPQTPDMPLYQPGVPIYEVYPSTLLLLNGVDTMQQRVGDRGYSTSTDGHLNGIWGRMQGQRFRPNAASSSSLADADYNSWQAEIGADRVLAESAKGSTLTGGLSARYGKASAQVGSLVGNGRIKTHGVGARATLTWQDKAGFYADAQVQVGWYDSNLSSSVLGKLVRGNDGRGQAYSLEVGQRIGFGGIAITPQMQAVYSKVRFDRFTDPSDADVSLRKGDSLKTRWGVTIDHQSGASRIYAVGNLTYDWLGDTIADVSGTPIARTDYRLWGELGLGGNVGVNDRLTLYGEATANSALKDFAKSYGLKGMVGVRMRF